MPPVRVRDPRPRQGISRRDKQGRIQRTDKVTIADVSQRAGRYAEHGVDLRFRGSDRKHPGLKVRLYEAIAALWPSHNQADRPLRAGLASVIGLIAPSDADPCCGIAARHVEAEAAERPAPALFIETLGTVQTRPPGVPAHSTHVRGDGRFEHGIEVPRAGVSLATRLPPETCARLALGYRNPDEIDPAAWQGREDEGILYVRKAGEMLYRLRDENGSH